MKAGGDCCYLPEKAWEEDEWEIQEVIASQGAAKEITLHDVIAAVLSKLE